jgi:hypothetical protein
VGRTLLLYAARAGQLATVKWLHDQGAPLDSLDMEGRNALHYAARRGHLEVATWLLEYGVSVQHSDVVRGCAKGRVWSGRRKWWWGGGAGGHPVDAQRQDPLYGLWLPCLWQHAMTPLHQATLGRSLPVCELLLKHGADLSSRDSVGEVTLPSPSPLLLLVPTLHALYPVREVVGVACAAPASA